MLDSILEAILDSLKTLPILLLVYLLIEFLEHKNEIKFEKIVSNSKRAGPFWGAVCGLIPQCGFSAIMADLFSRRMITIGTLFAVFIATSDEAIAILLAHPGHYKDFLLLLGIKFILAIILGIIIDLLFFKQKLNKNTLDHEHQVHDENCKESDEHNKLHHHHELTNDEHTADSIFLQALKHTLEIFIYILVANIIINLIIYWIGMDRINSFMIRNKKCQPLFTSLIGLIPNCAASVTLTELYIKNTINFASCIAGLITSGGIGLIILFKRNKSQKENFLIVLALYLIGLSSGLILNLII